MLYCRYRPRFFLGSLFPGSVSESAEQFPARAGWSVGKDQYSFSDPELLDPTLLLFWICLGSIEQSFFPTTFLLTTSEYSEGILSQEGFDPVVKTRTWGILMSKDGEQDRECSWLLLVSLMYSFSTENDLDKTPAASKSCGISLKCSLASSLVLSFSRAPKLVLQFQEEAAFLPGSSVWLHPWDWLSSDLGSLSSLGSFLMCSEYASDEVGLKQAEWPIFSLLLPFCRFFINSPTCPSALNDGLIGWKEIGCKQSLHSALLSF